MATNQLNTLQLDVLRRFAKQHGRYWKSKLRSAWTSGRDDRMQDGAVLRQIRNDFGPVWLTRFRLT